MQSFVRHTAVVMGLILAPVATQAQHAEHHPASAAAGPLPVQAGHAAFATIAEIVRLLDADPATDWSKVNIEALRQHLIDMDDVTMRTSVRQRSVPGGVEFEVTGSGRVAAAIRRITTAHVGMLDAGGQYRGSTAALPTGARITIVARDTANRAVAQRIRALGFVGLLTEGDHHPRHHLAMARGAAMSHSRE